MRAEDTELDALDLAHRRNTVLKLRVNDRCHWKTISEQQQPQKQASEQRNKNKNKQTKYDKEICSLKSL